MKTAMKRVASLLLALIMILEVVAPGVVEARSAGQNRATVSDEEFIPPDGNRIDPDQNAGSHLPNFIDPDDDGYYTPPQKAPARPAQKAPAQSAPKQGVEANDAADVEVSEEKAPKPLIEDEAKSKEMALEFSREKELARAKSPQGSDIANKKFTIITRFDTSMQNGPIKSGQYFVIHLDDKLKVNDKDSLQALSYEGKDITDKPLYNDTKNTITYKITKEIKENIQVPIEVQVDYNTDNIPEDAQSFTVVNSVSGLGVVNPKKLPPVVVDANGNMVSTILEPGRHDVIQVFDYGDDYKVSVDAFGDPVIQNGKIEGIRWNVRVSSKDPLTTLGYIANFTAVKGSGLGKFEEIQVNNEAIPQGDLTENDIVNHLGIVDSRHHTLGQSMKDAKDLYYTFYTPVTNVQASYMLDLSMALTGKNKVGAVRLVLPQGYSQEAIREATPTRVGMNNRTTVMGKFTSSDSATWTVTDAISSGDEGNAGLPLKTRTLEGDHTVRTAKAASYHLDSQGKMVVASDEHDVTNGPLPVEKEDPSGNQIVGTIAVYEVTTDLTKPNDRKKYSLAGVTISKCQDLYVEQEWTLPAGLKMPPQKFEVKDERGENLGELGPISEGKEGEVSRHVTIPDVKYWNIDDNGKATPIEHKIVQKFTPETKLFNGTNYQFEQGSNYYKTDTKVHYMHNRAIEKPDDTPVNFTLIKVDKDDPAEALQGAKYSLRPKNLIPIFGEKPIEVVTDSKGQARFTNVHTGEYTLKETKAPVGYKPDNTIKNVTVSQNGEVTVQGENVSLSGQAAKPQVVNHDHAPNWPDYMNAMHYGTLREDGTLEFYLYLKPESDGNGNGTNRRTRVNISIPGVTIEEKDIAAYDVYPSERKEIKAAMESRTAGAYINKLGNTVINANNNNMITGSVNEQDSYTGKTGYQITIPKERFAGDWGFLVKVTKKIDDAEMVNLSYDWLTDQDTAQQTNLRKELVFTKQAQGESEAVLTFTNESLVREDVAVTKINKDKEPLSGATFIIKDEDDNTIATKQSDINGEANFGKLPAGKYTIEETKAPDGYLANGVVLDATVDEEGKVTYKARFKDGLGTPTHGQDYIIESEDAGETTDAGKVISVKQRLFIREDDGAIGVRPNVWEAYKYESLNYEAKFKVKTSPPGSRFSIQFDPNLDFTQYVKEIPSIPNADGVIVAEPYMDYETNRLTYVFNEKSEGGEFEGSISIRGIIPDKYFAQKDGEYEFTNKFAPGVKGVIGNQEDTTKVKVNYEQYDQGQGSPVSQSYYFGDVYKKGNVRYVDVIAYYNPLGDANIGRHTLKFSWASTDYGGNKNIALWMAKGYKPAFELESVKIFSTLPDTYRIDDKIGNNVFQKLINDNMPLSFGLRPEQDPYKYTEVYSRTIDPNSKTQDTSRGFILKYDPGQIQMANAQIKNKTPLSIAMPPISGQREGYVIKQTFKITDEDQWRNYWRVFYMGNGTKLESAFATKARAGRAVGDQTHLDIPKYTIQKVKLINRDYKPGHFTIHKVSRLDRNKNLANAVFELTDAEGKVYRRKSGNDGELIFQNLAPGTYSLTETAAPAGFVPSDKTWQVSVDMRGRVSIIERSVVGDDTTLVGEDITLEVTNNPVGKKFRVYKKDADGKPLEGAKFKITPYGKTPGAAQEATSNESGVVEFEKPLTNGTYTLEEIQAPTGYNKLDQQWVVVVKGEDIKIYNRLKADAGTAVESLLREPNTNWVNVAKRPTAGWTDQDNRLKGYDQDKKLGTRIVAINKNAIQPYVVQRYIINPEGATLPKDKTSVQIHREKPTYENMDWYDGSPNSGEDFTVYKLTKMPVTGNVEDLRLTEYGVEKMTEGVDFTTGATSKSDETAKRQKFDFKIDIDTPIVIDVKVPYKEESGGVGTGMDLWIDGAVSWKSDYYERVSDIVVGDSTTGKEQGGDIIGTHVADGTLDVTNDVKRYGFKLKKVKDDGSNTTIQGATFTLTGPDSGKDERKKVTDENGVIEFNNLAPGTYKLEETVPAPGYKQDDTTWTITVTNEGKVYMKDNSSTGFSGNWFVPDANDPSSNQGSRNAVRPIGSAPFSAVGSAAESAQAPEPVAKESAEKAETPIAKAEEAKESAEKAPSVTAEKKDAAKAADVAKAENADVAEAVSPIADQISTTKQLNNFLTTFGANSGLELGDEIVPSPVGAGGWETIDPDRSEGFREGSDMAKNNGAPVVTKMTEINKDDNQLKQSFIFSPSPFGNANREIQIHREPEYDLNKADIVQVSFYKVSGNTFENMGRKVPQNIRYNINRKVGNGPYRIYATIPSGITGPILVEVTVKYDQNKGVGLGTNYNSNMRASYDNKSWLAHSYASEDGINCKFDVNIQTDGNGTVTADKQNPVKKGEKVTLNVQPTNGYKLKSLTMNGTPLSSPYQFTMPDSNVTVNATFEPINTDYSINFMASPWDGGQVNETPKSAKAGETIDLSKFHYTENPGYEFNGWKVYDGTYKEIPVNGNTFTMPASNVTVSATFKVASTPQPTGHDVTVNSDNNGQVTADPATNVAENKDVTLKITSNPGYELKELSVTDSDGNAVTTTKVDDTTRTFKMPASNVTVTASFKPASTGEFKILSVTSDPTKGGTASANKPNPVRAGDVVTLTATPKDGYKFDKFVVKDVNGKAIEILDKDPRVAQQTRWAPMAKAPARGAQGSVTKYFIMPASDVTITAKFVKQNEAGIEITDQVPVIKNTQVGLELKLFKNSYSGLPLGGAKFTLEKYKTDAYRESDSTFTKLELTSDKIDGSIPLKDKNGNTVRLKPGFYLLKETGAPEGYKLITAPWKIEVKEENGRLVAKYSGPKDTPTTYIDSAHAKVKVEDNSPQTNGITCQSRVTYIDPETKTFVQRLYVDTRGYTGTEKINVQIEPRVKREEIDTPGKPPETIKGREGVKTAYRTTYAIDLEKAKPAPNPSDVLKSYDLSKPGVSMVNTARWRPFDWGFEEDQLNLDKGVYFIDIEGYYDDNIVNKKGAKIVLDVNFSTERKFMQADREPDGTIKYKNLVGGSYQKGNIALGSVYGPPEKGGNEIGNAQPDGQKYANGLSKEYDYGGKHYLSGYVSEGTPIQSVTTTIDMGPLYASDEPEDIPQEGLTLENDEEAYNITFSKHGRKVYNWDPTGEKVTNNRLEGAVFKLQKLVGEGYEDVEGSYVSSAFNGYFGFRNLKPGRYRLMEVEAPEGYTPIKDAILYMSIKYKKGKADPKTGNVTPGKGQITLEYGSNSSGIYQYVDANNEVLDGSAPLVDFVTSGTAKNMGKIVNEKPGPGKVTIKKLDENGKALPGEKNQQGELTVGAKFKLTRLSANKSGEDGAQIGTVGEDGTLVFENLILGNYKLEELEPHPGHINDGQVWYFTVGGKGTDGKNLDPFADDNLQKRNDLTQFITLDSSEMTILRPQKDDDSKDLVIRPHYGACMEFTNEYTLQEGTRINPGDYFVLKLSDNIDLKGIHTNKVGQLDIFADGVGTIAKAAYNEKEGTVTYTFTNYAGKYELRDFSNRLSAFINPHQVRKTDLYNAQSVGMGVGDKPKIEHPVYVDYASPVGRGSEWIKDRERQQWVWDSLNLRSKIVEFNQDTGKFVQYFYVNRDKAFAYSSKFRYTPNVAVDNLTMDVRLLKSNDDRSFVRYMPESFGVNWNDVVANNWKWGGGNFGTVKPDNPAVLTIPDMYSTMSAIIRVEGTIADMKNNAPESYESEAKLYQYLVGPELPWAKRQDKVFIFQNESTAKADLTIKATNPKNRIKLKKIDTDGNALGGVKFTLDKKVAGEFTATGKTLTTDKDGLIQLEGLKAGEYRIRETGGLKDYVTPEEAVVEFKVSPNSGKIFRKVKDDYVEENGTVPIQVVNHKPIVFKKIDAGTREILPGAVFEVYYNENKPGDYEKYTVDEGGESETLTVIADPNGEVKLELSKPGYYALKETKAPKDYIKPSGYVKEFSLSDQGLRMNEQGFEGNVRKGWDSDDKDTSLLFAEKGTTEKSFNSYLVINPANKERSYDKDPMVTCTVGKDAFTNPPQTTNLTVDRIAKDGTKKTATLNSVPITDGKIILTRQQIFGSAGDAASSEALVITMPFTGLKENTTEVDLQFEIADNSGTHRSFYKFTPGSLSEKVVPYPVKKDSQQPEDYQKDLASYLETNGKKPLVLKYKENSSDLYIDNTKGVYPFTGGFGPRWIVIIGAVIAAVAAEEYIRRKRTSAPKGGA